MPALATINVLSGALRGAGDTRWPWVIVVFGYIAVRIPITYLLAAPGGLGWGLYGAWVAMLVDLCVRALLIDKDNSPQWEPATPEEVTDEMLDVLFEPLPASEAWTAFPEARG